MGSLTIPGLQNELTDPAKGDMIAARDTSATEDKKLKLGSFDGLHFRKVFGVSDLTFEQINPGDLTLNVDTGMNVFEDRDPLDIYYWDARTTTTTEIQMKLVDDFTAEKDPIIGEVEVQIEGGLSFITGVQGSEFVIDLVLQKQAPTETDFTSIKTTTAFIWISGGSFEEKEFNSLSQSLKVDDLSNLPFEEGDTMRILLKIQEYDSVASTARNLLNPISKTGSFTEFSNNIDSIKFFQHRILPD